MYLFLPIPPVFHKNGNVLDASKNRISIKIQSLRKNALNAEHCGRHQASNHEGLL